MTILTQTDLDAVSFDRRKVRRFNLGSLYNCKGAGRIVAFRRWSRDCDCAESESLYLMAADADKVNAYIEKDYEWADGPMSYTLLTLEEAREFEGSFRDRALEAYENGHPYSIHDD